MEKINHQLNPLIAKLTHHELYESLSNLDHVKTFMRYHVFAVWDFMSLLKSLQSSLTCTTVPWIPSKNSNTARFINEIVLGEETDQDEHGYFKSHFDMYLSAMKQAGADTSKIDHFISLLQNDADIDEALNQAEVNAVVSDFVKFTFDVIATGKPHVVASVFTFGREGLIADMFIEILNHASKINDTSYSSMIYYLERHIELDGDEHGPMSMKMIEELCDNDEDKILEVIDFAKQALHHRIKLWDLINDKINR